MVMVCPDSEARRSPSVAGITVYKTIYYITHLARTVLAVKTSISKQTKFLLV
jgi:hypothetical protein